MMPVPLEARPPALHPGPRDLIRAKRPLCCVVAGPSGEVAALQGGDQEHLGHARGAGARLGGGTRVPGDSGEDRCASLLFNPKP